MEKMKDRLERAKEKLMKKIPFEFVTKIPKYRSFNMAQYLQLVDKLESIAILLLESYIFTQNKPNESIKI